MNRIKNLIVYGSLLMSNTVLAQGTETRKLSSFSKLEAGGSFDVILETGTEESVRIVAEGVSPEKIITEVKNNTLEVYMKKDNYRNIKIRVYVTYKSLEAKDENERAGGSDRGRGLR